MRNLLHILIFTFFGFYGLGQNQEWQTVTIDKFLSVKLPGVVKTLDTLSTLSYNAYKDSDIYIVQYVEKPNAVKDAKFLQAILQGAVDGFIKTQKYSEVSIIDTSIGGTFGKLVKIKRENLPGPKSRFLYITLANSHFYTIAALSNQATDKVSNQDFIFYYNSVKFDSVNIKENSFEFRNIEEKRFSGGILLLSLIFISFVALIIFFTLKRR